VLIENALGPPRKEFWQILADAKQSFHRPFQTWIYARAWGKSAVMIVLDSGKIKVPAYTEANENAVPENPFGFRNGASTFVGAGAPAQYFLIDE
jgi:hypothetical protein